MKLIIAGSRTLHPSFGFIDGLRSLFGLTNIKEIVSGGAVGVDRAVERYVNE